MQQILDGCFLLMIGSGVTLAALANFNKPGHAFMPGRLDQPKSYWGLILYAGGAALLGLYALAMSH